MRCTFHAAYKSTQSKRWRQVWTFVGGLPVRVVVLQGASGPRPGTSSILNLGPPTESGNRLHIRCEAGDAVSMYPPLGVHGFTLLSVCGTIATMNIPPWTVEPEEELKARLPNVRPSSYATLSQYMPLTEVTGTQRSPVTRRLLARVSEKLECVRKPLKNFSLSNSSKQYSSTTTALQH